MTFMGLGPTYHKLLAKGYPVICTLTANLYPNFCGGKGQAPPAQPASQGH